MKKHISLGFILTVWLILFIPVGVIVGGFPSGLSNLLHLSDNYYSALVALIITPLVTFSPMYYVSTRAKTGGQAIAVLCVGSIVFMIETVLLYIGDGLSHIDCGDSCVNTVIPEQLQSIVTNIIIIIMTVVLIFALVRMFLRIIRSNKQG